MSLIYTFAPLGNSQYGDIGRDMTNTFGSTHPVITDLLGGVAANYVVAPPISFQWPEDWGMQGYEIPIVPQEPYVPPPCLAGCTPPWEPPPVDNPVPEPGYAFVLGIAMFAAIVVRKVSI